MFSEYVGKWRTIVAFWKQIVETASVRWTQYVINDETFHFFRSQPFFQVHIVSTYLLNDLLKKICPRCSIDIVLTLCMWADNDVANFLSFFTSVSGFKEISWKKKIKLYKHGDSTFCFWKSPKSPKNHLNVTAWSRRALHSRQSIFLLVCVFWEVARVSSSPFSSSLMI